MSNPRVVSLAAQDAQGQPVRFTIATDILDYYEAAQTFGRNSLAAENAHGQFQRRVIAVPDRAGAVVTPMMLTIGSDNGLYLVRKAQGANVGGWQLIDMGEALRKLTSGPVQVRAIGANWSDDDRITLAIAVDNGGQGAPSRVLVAYDQSSTSSDWGNLPWIDCGTREQVRVEGIRVLDEGDGSWTVVLAGDRGPDDTLYLLRKGQAPSFAQALIFNPAVTLQAISDFETIVHPIFGGGLAVLGTSGGANTLAFRPFPTYNAQGRIASIAPVVILPCPTGANVLEAGATRNGATDLYVGGQGLHLISGDEMANAEDAQLVAVASPVAAPNVQDLVIADAPDGGVAVWALLQDSSLEIVRRPAGGAWGAPLALRGGVQEIAPVHGDDHLSASLLVIYTDGRAATLWQDRGSGAWQEQPLLVANPDQATRVTCYGTSLRALDGAGIPRPGVKVRVSASITTSVLLNNNAVFIGPGVSFETKTDVNGSVSLFDRVRSLTPAVYRFEVDGQASAIDVDPAGGVHERLRTLTADELRNATLTTPQGPKPLLPDSYRSGANSAQVAIVASSLNKVSQLAAAADNAAPGVRQVQNTATFSSALSAAAVPAGFRWGLQADANGVRVADGGLVDSLINAAESVGEFFVNLGESITDFFEGIGRRVQEAWTFVLHKAEEAFEFICALGNKVKRFVLDTVEQIGSFFTWLWDQIETGLEKVWEWLKFVFNWEDILVVRDAMVESVDEALQYLQSEITPLKETVARGFGLAVDQLHKWRAEAGGTPVLPHVATGQSVIDDMGKAMQPINQVIDEVSGNSVVSWVMNKLQAVADELIRFEGPNPAKELLDAGVEYVEGLLADEISNFMNFVNQFSDDLKLIFEGKMPGASELSFESIKNALIILGTDVLEGLVNAVRDLTLRSLDLLQKLVGVIRDAMFAKIRFPFIEHLVSLVTGGSVSVDTSFRMIDGVMLLAAIPATIGYKIIKGEAPLRRGEVINFPFGNVTVQSDFDALRRYSWVAGLAGSFVKLLVAGYDAYQQADAAIGGTTVSPSSAAMKWVGVVFSGVGVAGEVLGRHTTKTTPVSEIEWSNVAVSGLLTTKLTATVLAGHAGVDAKKLAKINGGIDVGGLIIHFIMRTAIFGVIIDDDRQSAVAAEVEEQLPESLAWIEALFDQGGSAVIAGANLDDEPTTKAILLVSGAAGKGMAFVTHLTRTILSVNKGYTLTT